MVKYDNTALKNKIWKFSHCCQIAFLPRYHNFVTKGSEARKHTFKGTFAENEVT